MSSAHSVIEAMEVFLRRDTNDGDLGAWADQLETQLRDRFHVSLVDLRTVAALIVGSVIDNVYLGEEVSDGLDLAEEVLEAWRIDPGMDVLARMLFQSAVLGYIAGRIDSSPALAEAA